ncbi:ARP2/3 complex, 21kDa subunit (p21-Arc) [Carpediemonas membranifera]|uniref:Actin-related protein 2/3 complex subunit 3 n=1 Tax=Carpediemonas membranifera TaxID=201153 RepID=A0A8J6B1B7_9EUKA|nr:ARP2/3 complex, 21kDa subunit (p21-Arc) [Carpediemonas membranifera]|eukprot:KAG9396330.1 ARP2/3 complex, 21kDa subunit (p21-Arc) [Carpediemonas membranifera]
MVYHSAFNGVAPADIACGCGIFGPEHDITQEAIENFKANVLVKQFEMKGPGDTTMVYLTLFICKCLTELNMKKPADAKAAYNVLNVLAQQNFSAPGDAEFVLRGILSAPQDSTERDRWVNGFKKMRAEIATKLAPLVFDADGKLSKWWLMFAKYKFMGKSL